MVLVDTFIPFLHNYSALNMNDGGLCKCKLPDINAELVADPVSEKPMCTGRGGVFAKLSPWQYQKWWQTS